MENIIFNELKIRGFNVDVGVIVQYDTNEKGNSIRKQLEIDFVCNQGSKRYYIQSAYAIPDQAKDGAGAEILDADRRFLQTNYHYQRYACTVL